MHPAPKIAEEESQRLCLTVRGAVQGVGFRPFIYRLAKELDLTGWVNNSSSGVFIEVEGASEKLSSFLLRIKREKPPRSFIQSLESKYLDAAGFSEFEIRPSDDGGTKTALVMPDISTCSDCVLEIFDPGNRRYQYPFTNCTNCGPRFSIIEALPYDRPQTTMKHFEMCERCHDEYNNPLDRRFHAQPNACPVCGPQIELWDEEGDTLYKHHEALQRTAMAITGGAIVAVKGLGGFHLMVDARNDEAVEKLRLRKRREEKPFALMFPDLDAAENVCEVSEAERRLLTSPESPIVLLNAIERRDGISRLAAPGNPYLGVMLPYTPLHHLLMSEMKFPVVATSGNLSDEPICIDENEAIKRLQGIADLFLVHNRPIVRHVDDSIVREMSGREMVLRRARGFAPLPVRIEKETRAILATGAHLKNAVATASGNQVFISQHIGDLETVKAFEAFENVIESFKRLYGINPEAVVSDTHPDYLSSRFAAETSLPHIRVQHHYAHVLSCMAENELDAPVLGVAWDGTGLGTDSTIWGGEFLCVNDNGFARAAHLRTFRLPGGDQAVKEPRRTALGILFEIFGNEVFQMNDIDSVAAFTSSELSVIRKMLENNLNAPVASSAGRLFDGVASIIGLRHKAAFEGQAAMELEFAIDRHDTDECYPYSVGETDSTPKAIDWSMVIKGIIEDKIRNESNKKIAAKFHNSLVEMIVGTARLVDEKCVALTGGCFQNKYLTDRAVNRLREEGFKVYWHQRVPPNDGGIALGQALAAVRNRKRGE